MLRPLRIECPEACYEEFQDLKNMTEKLSGKLKDKYSIRVNDQWRLIFTWENEHGEADDIYLDNHSYK